MKRLNKLTQKQVNKGMTVLMSVVAVALFFWISKEMFLFILLGGR